MNRRSQQPETASVSGPFKRRFLVEAARDRARHEEIAAEPAECLGVAGFLGLVAVKSLVASFTITPLSGGRFEVTGKVRASVVQSCVVSLDDFDADIIAPVAVLFAPLHEERGQNARDAAPVSRFESDDPPDPIVRGGIDLGQVAVEFLSLALEPYPRKPGIDSADRQAAADTAPAASPFAALAHLKPG